MENLCWFGKNAGSERGGNCRTLACRPAHRCFETATGARLLLVRCRQDSRSRVERQEAPKRLRHRRRSARSARSGDLRTITRRSLEAADLVEVVVKRDLVDGR